MVSDMDKYGWIWATQLVMFSYDMFWTTFNKPFLRVLNFQPQPFPPDGSFWRTAKGNRSSLINVSCLKSSIEIVLPCLTGVNWDMDQTLVWIIGDREKQIHRRHTMVDMAGIWWSSSLAVLNLQLMYNVRKTSENANLWISFMVQNAAELLTTTSVVEFAGCAPLGDLVMAGMVTKFRGSNLPSRKVRKQPNPSIVNSLLEYTCRSSFAGPIQVLPWAMDSKKTRSSEHVETRWHKQASSCLAACAAEYIPPFNNI